MSVGTFARRLKEARKLTGLSQKNLGIKAGLDESLASTRINRYEQGLHEPDPELAGRLAEVLGVPRAYLYADNDQLAEMIKLFSKLNQDDREFLIDQLRKATAHEG